MFWEWFEKRPLMLARIGLLLGLMLFLLINVLWLIYFSVLIFTRGDPESVWNLYWPLQVMILTIDVVAGALLTLGFWQFGLRHDTIRTQATNVALGFGVWTLVTFTWRLKLLWTPAVEVNPISRHFKGGEFGLFVPHFDFLRDNYLGFFLSSMLLFILMFMLVTLIKNYRVYESFRSVNLNLFRVYGLFHLVGTILMGLGWFAFSPESSATVVGSVLFVVFIMAMCIMYIALPLLGVWVFQTAFVIHRSALETLGFIIRRKAEREELIGETRGRGEAERSVD